MKYLDVQGREVNPGDRVAYSGKGAISGTIETGTVITVQASRWSCWYSIRSDRTGLPFKKQHDERKILVLSESRE